MPVPYHLFRDESEAEVAWANAHREATMHKMLLTMFASAALLAAGSVVSNANETGAGAHHKRIARHHQPVTHARSDITSFSSSSELHVGVNHPPKNR
jgi:hypothetical protein